MYVMYLYYTYTCMLLGFNYIKRISLLELLLQFSKNRKLIFEKKFRSSMEFNKKYAHPVLQNNIYQTIPSFKVCK